MEISAGVGVVIGPDSAKSADVRVDTGVGTIIGVNVGPGVEASVDIGILVEIGVRLGVDAGEDEDEDENAVSSPHPMILKANIIISNDRTTAAISVFIQSAPLSSDSAKKVDMLNSS